MQYQMESERLNAQHDMIQDFFDNELFFGHDGSKPDKVLDCGYGQVSKTTIIQQIHAYL